MTSPAPKEAYVPSTPRPPRVAGSSLPTHVDLTENGWQLVRHCPAGVNWHPATDRLRGTAS